MGDGEEGCNSFKNTKLNENVMHPRMLQYRLYQFDAAGGITAAEWIDAKSDDEAIVLVRARKLPSRCEIWEGNRLIAEFASRHGEEG